MIAVEGGVASNGYGDRNPDVGTARARRLTSVAPRRLGRVGR